MTDNKSSVERCYLHLWWFYFSSKCTILESIGTWVCRRGQLLQSSRCQWQTLIHWCWLEYLYRSPCHNWRVGSSCCSCPLEKKTKVLPELLWYLHKEQLAVVFIRFVKTVWSLVTSGEDDTRGNVKHAQSALLMTFAPYQCTVHRCRWTRTQSRWSTWLVSLASKH